MAAISPILSRLARTVLAHNRLEPRPRSHEFNRSLRAEVRDAAWLLARQWQVKEFRAEDRGSPAYADLTVRASRPTQLQLGNNPARSFAPDMPWEAQLHAQPTLVDGGLRLRMGLAWVRLLREQGLGRFTSVFRTQFPLAAEPEPAPEEYSLTYAQAQTTPEIQAVLSTSGSRAVDGYALFTALGADNAAAATLVGAAADTSTQATLTRLAVSYLNSYQRLYFAHSPASAWSVTDLQYEFALALPDADGPRVLAGQQQDGSSFQWHAVDQAVPATYPALTSAPANSTDLPIQVIPTEIEFAGTPAARWWDFEDHRVDIGRVTGDSSDFGRMLLQEFVLLYQNDWFSIPCSVPVGSLAGIRGVVVTDVFGQRYRIHAAGVGTLREADGQRIDHDGGQWSLFGRSQRNGQAAASSCVLTPHAALTPLVGRPVEQVTLLREEATNLVWAIEQTIPDGFGGGMDGSSAAARVAEYLRNRATVSAPATAAYTYQLTSSVAENWIPFVPRPDAAGLVYLEQGEIPRQVAGLALQSADQTVQPRTPLLRLDAGQPYLIHDYHVPPNGVQLEGSYRRARGLNGSVALWYEYRRAPAKRAGGSGLQFDTLLPGSGTGASTAPNDDAMPPAVTPDEQNQAFNLDRYDQYLSVALPALPALSISFWVQVGDANFPNGWHYLLDGRNLRDNTWFASLGIGSDWTWYLDGVQRSEAQLAGTLTPNVWHHVVLMTGATQAGDLLMNARFTQNEFTRAVRFANVCIYDRPMQAAEIDNLVTGPMADGLVARFTFAPGPRLTAQSLQATDVSGNEHHGILHAF